MPIRMFLGSEPSFASDDLKVIGEAFSRALNKVGLNAGDNPMVEMIARRIIRAALNGERDPVRLCEIGVGPSDEVTAQAEGPAHLDPLS
jgi:hypothetical protein